MKILFDKDKSRKYPYIITILRNLEDKFGDEVVVSNFKLENGDVLINLKSVSQNKEYMVRINKVCQFNPRINNCSRSIFVYDNTNHFEEYICDISDYSRCYKENDIYLNNDMYILKSHNKNYYLMNYTLQKGDLETKIIEPIDQEIFCYLFFINDIGLIDVYRQLSAENPAFVENITIESYDKHHNIREALTVENGNLQKYEKDYINNNNVAINLLYSSNGLEILTKHNIFYDEQDLLIPEIKNEIKKIKSLFK